MADHPSPRYRSAARVAPWLCAAAAFGLYSATVAPTISWGDQAEFPWAAHQLAICHPTGYPFYVCALKLVQSLLAFGSLAWRTNLASSLAAAAAVGLTCAAAGEVLGTTWGVLTAVAIAVSGEFWLTALVADAHAFTGLFFALQLWTLTRWRTTHDVRWLLSCALATGIGLGGHLLLALTLPALFAELALDWRHDGQRWSQCLLVLLAGVALALTGLALYAYLPLRAHQNLSQSWWQTDPATIGGFLVHVSGAGYLHLLSSSSSVLLLNWGKLSAWAAHGYGVSLILVALGAPAMLRLRWRAPVWHLLGSAVCIALYCLQYEIPDLELYYVPLSMVAAWMGVAATAWVTGGLLGWSRRHGRPPVFAAGWLAIAVTGWAVHVEWQTARGDYTVLDFAHSVVETAPAGAVVVADWFSAAPVEYCRYAEGRDLDFEVVGSFDLVESTKGLSLVRQLAARQPVCFVDYVLGATPYVSSVIEEFALQPLGHLVRVDRRWFPRSRLATASDSAPLAQFGGEWELVSLTIEPERARQGEVVWVSHRWRALRDGVDNPQVVAVLGSPDGKYPVIAGTETPVCRLTRLLYAGRHPVGGWRGGDEIVERLPLPLQSGFTEELGVRLSDIDPGSYNMLLGMRGLVDHAFLPITHSRVPVTGPVAVLGKLTVAAR